MANRNRSSPGGGWGIIVPFFIAAIIFTWPYAVWHGCRYGGGSGLSGCGASSEWVWNAQTWIAQGIWWAILIPATGLIAHGIYRQKYPRAVRPSPRTHFPDGEPLPPPGRASASLPHAPEPAAVPQPPLCLHLNAVKVDNLVYPELPPWAWLCPDPPQGCGEALPEEFGRLARSCCGTPPGTRHARNCPQAE